MDEPTHTPKASLLGLPCELRFQICEIVLQFDVNNDAETKKCPNHSTPLKIKLKLPIRSLAMSCRSVADEVRAVTRSLHSSERFSIVTMAMSDWEYGAFYVRRAPCPIMDLKALKIEVIHQTKSFSYFDRIMTELHSGSLGVHVHEKVRKNLLSRRGLLSKARGLGKTEVYVRFPPPDQCGQPQEDFNQAMQDIRTEVEGELRPNALFATTGAVLSTKFSVDE